MRNQFHQNKNHQKKPAKIAGFKGLHLVTLTLLSQEALLSITPQIYKLY